ncbi:MAG TPA: o-succinylbenzoate synthase [Gemmatimonadales bacterium]|nr:o-succinylbenzoate synthase [Gemmatimonadales bacterium]
MRLASVELYRLALPLLEPFIISGGSMEVRRSLVVIIRDDEGHAGYGEAPPFELPFYSEETLASAFDLLQRVLIPRIEGAEIGSPEEMHERLTDGIRGNPFARAALETAMWDLEAARRGSGVAALLGERLGVAPASSVPCGVALGIPADRSLATLERWIAEAIARGYRRVKIKVAPGWDLEPVAAAQRALGDSGLPLTVDANGAYRWPEHEAALRGLDQFGLLYIEQPLAPGELVGHASLSRALETPICLDETLRDASAARQVAELQGPRIWNLKVHRVGGLTEALTIYRIAEQYGADLWAGTMPESGIGSQAALAAASLPRFIYPSDLEPSTRWFGRNVDVIKLVMGPDGRMPVSRLSVSHLLDRGRFDRSTERLR